MKHNVRLPLLVLSLAALSALPTLASPVERGIDLWQTPANGSTFADFARYPIPAGFFCHQSEAFTGRIALRGAPLVTGVSGELGSTDTIVERLDRAAFDPTGNASTRIRVRALNLVSLAPLSTACGDFNLRVTLHGGNQPITHMQIVQDSAEGGRFFAPLQMNLKLTFTPATGKSSERFTLVRNNFRLAAAPGATWSVDSDKRSIHRQGPVFVDTDGDSVPDSLVPGTSTSFVAGLRSERGKTTVYVCCPSDYSDFCHTGSDGQHCTTYAMDPRSPSCC